MGRREEPIDPAAGPVQQFAMDLRKLREAAGTPSYRELATRAHFSPSALSAAARGRDLPSWPVVRAFVSACGGDEKQWLDRWLEASSCLPDPAPEPAALGATNTRATEPAPAGAQPTDCRPTDAEAETADAGTTDAEPGPTGPRGDAPARVPGLADGDGAVASGSSVAGRVPIPPAAEILIAGLARRRSRRRWPMPGLVAVLAAALAIGGLLWPTAGKPPAQRAAPAVVSPGHDCDPHGIIAPTAAPTAQGTPRLRMDFEPGGLVWGPYWAENNVHESLVYTQPYQGRSSLEVRVGPGIGAFGTVHVDGLAPGATISLHLWYGGQGQGIACPFVQDPGYAIQWVPVAPVVLAATTRPGWRTVQWQMPDVPVHGVGLQLTNTGLNDLVIRVDAVQW